jgi:cytochrome b subunit of formate dehydrogenase
MRPLALGVALVAVLASPLAGAQSAEANPENAACLACHGQAGFTPHVTSVGELDKSVHAPRACLDCHKNITGIPHERRQGAARSAGQLAIIREGCGVCHAENFKSYSDTYHGQVTTLGHTYTAMCFDCHGKHDIQRVKDPASTVHPDNRLQTCQKCHAGATQGFVTFQPHANTHDRERYPAMFYTAKFMMLLISGVFLFFWTHCLLWFYREWRDRRDGKSMPHVDTAALGLEFKGRHFRRFSPLWRIAHLLFALCVMTLALTGMAAFYADTAWAAAVMRALGGPKVAAIVHRSAGVLILTIFLAQLAYFVVKLAPKWRTFGWWGHTSLVPGPQDFFDIVAMFKWFFGKGPRPVFGRWSYWERFDYWAPFWGLTIVGGTGLMLWFKEATAAVWPGWMFNIATLAHGEEAFLAICFLFTVHFFNNHFRPDKLPPPDVVMFTGTQSLEEFARDHTLEYRELLASGELQKHLVPVPSRAMTLGSKILGLLLLAAGLAILTMVLIGFFQHLNG